MRLLLIRHTKVQVGEGICYGDSDVELAESFEKEAEEIRWKLSDWQNAIVYSSPLQRCVQLTKYLFENQFQIKPELKEMNFGSWSMKKWSSIPEDEINPWYEDYVNYQIPKGESFIEFYNKIVSFYEEESKQEEQDMVWVTHAGVIRSLVSYTLQMELKNAFRFSVSYGSLTIIKKEKDSLFLERLNY